MFCFPLPFLSSMPSHRFTSLTPPSHTNTAHGIPRITRMRRIHARDDALRDLTGCRGESKSSARSSSVGFGLVFDGEGEEDVGADESACTYE